MLRVEKTVTSILLIAVVYMKISLLAVVFQATRLGDWRQERAEHKLISTRSQVVINLEGAAQENLCLFTRMLRDRRRRSAPTNLEDGL